MSTNLGQAIVNLEDLDGDPAADELYEQAKEDVDIDKPDIALLFCSPEFNLAALVGRLGHRVKEDEGELIGGTTAGEINNEGAHMNTAVLLIIQSDEIEFQTGHSNEIWKDPIEKGRIAAIRATEGNFFTTEKNKGVFAISAGLTNQRPSVEFDLLKGIAKEIGTSTPVAGGSSGDNLKLENNHQFYNQNVYDESCVLLTIKTDLKILTGQEHGLHKKIKTGIITKSDGHSIKEISGEPAAEWYAEAVGSSFDELSDTFVAESGTELQNIFREALEKTLGEQITENNIRAITPIQVLEDKSLFTTVEPEENNAIHVIEGQQQEVINAASNAFPDVKNLEPVFGLVSNCAIRSAGMQEEEMQNEIEKLTQKIESPIIGFYGYGEIGGKEDNYCTFNNQTVSGLLIAKEE